MNAKDKAKELVDKYLVHTMYNDCMAGEWVDDKESAKVCALIIVDEILNLDVWDWPHNAEKGVIFWEEVKKEIKLIS